MMNMIKIIPIFLCFCLEVESQNVFINGTVKNYSSETIPFFKKDYTTFQNKQIPIIKFSDNRFEIEFYNPKPQLFKLFLEWVYIEPGDSIQFDFSFIDVSPTEFYDSIDARGKYPGNYSYYINSRKWMNDKPVFKTGIHEAPESFYKSLKTFYFKTFAQRIDSFIKQNPVSQNFYKFIKDELQFKFLTDLLQTFKKNSVKISKQLNTKIEKDIKLSKLTDIRFLDALSYVYFSEVYLSYFLPKNNEISNSFENYLSLKEMIEKKFSGILREFWMSQLVRNQYFNRPAIYIAKEDSLTNTILASLKDTSIRQSLSVFVFTQSNRNEEAVKKIQLKDQENRTVTIGQIINNDTGFIKIIDFWASWCVPCINESKKFEELSDELKDVRIIKISVDKKEDDWRMALKKHGYSLKRQFLILNENEEKMLSTLINLESIPRFLIITKTGKIVFYQAFAPSNKKEFLQQIVYADLMDIEITTTENENKKSGPPKPPGN